ncbi:hypothetical protein QQP08_009693 [Theobroma cacao]|nr:hypothetical protein QQP08_009693 [Theobroma cacao]
MSDQICTYEQALRQCVINGLEGQKSFQDLDLEQLRILNKPFLESIKTDECCVNIDKQPAFDHPLLKNHQIQVFPLPLYLYYRRTLVKPEWLLKHVWLSNPTIIIIHQCHHLYIIYCYPL